MIWDESISKLQYHLAELYPLQDNIIPLADRAGINPASIPTSNKGIEMWYNVLTEAHRQQLLPSLLTEVQRDYPKDAFIKNFIESWTGDTSSGSSAPTKSLIESLIDENKMDSAWALVEPLTSNQPENEANLLGYFAEASRLYEMELSLDGRNKHRVRKKRTITLHNLKELIRDL